MDNVLAKIGLFCQYFRFWQKLVILELQCSIYWHGSGFFGKRTGYFLQELGILCQELGIFWKELNILDKNWVCLARIRNFWQ